MTQNFLHDTRYLRFRRPFGAVKAGQSVTIALFTGQWAGSCALRLWADNEERIVSGRARGEWVEFCFTAEHTGLVWYYFILENQEGRRYYGAKGGVACGEGQLTDYPPPSWQITVYDPAFETPCRFGEGLVYQIFPDRFFRQGRGGLARAKTHEAMGRRVLAHENWEEPVDYLPQPGEKDYDPCDFYGGDLNGIRQKLPYLKELGVTCIYLNPVFESQSNHRYNTADYLKIDPMLGDEADFQALAEEAKALGITLMLDGVFSHTGDDSVYFNKKGNYPGPGACQSQTSPYYPWYTFRHWPDRYACWWNFETLPEVVETEPSYQAFIGSVLDRYAAMGATSWRLDVADELPDAFIAFLRRRVKGNDPQGMLLGEVWEDASNKQGYGRRRKFVDGAELDGVMNYPFRDAVCDFLLFRTDAYGLCLRLTALRENYPPPFFKACLTMLSSHDTVRIATVLGGAPGRDALTRREQAEFTLRPDQLARGRARQVLALMLQLAHPGAPCVYYGDEAGLTGMADPFNRATYPWGKEDNHLLSRYRLLTRARMESPAMRQGACGFAAISEDVFAILRTHAGNCALTLVNRGEQAHQVSVEAALFDQGPDADNMWIAETLTEVLTGAQTKAPGGKVNLVLPPLSGALLIG